MPRVMIVNSYGNPVDRASKWGEIIEITQGNLNPFAIDRLAWSISPKLNQFSAEDYLLLTGPGSGHIISTLLILNRLEAFNCLRYEASTRNYEKVIISRKEVESALKDLPPSEEREPGRIFVINYSGHSIEPALEFSTLPETEKLVLMTQGNIDQYAISDLIKTIATQMNGFTEGDMLLLSGPAILHIIAAAVLSVLGKSFNVLIYNPKARKYSKREVNLPHLINIMQLVNDAKVA